MRVQNDVHGNNNNNNQAVNQNNNQNNENRAAAAENPAVADENQPAPQPRQLPNAASAATNAAADPAAPRTEPSAPRIPERPSPVAITLLAIRTFFLSLVPEHHTLWTAWQAPRFRRRFAPILLSGSPRMLFRAARFTLNYSYIYIFIVFNAVLMASSPSIYRSVVAESSLQFESSRQSTREKGYRS